MRLSLVTTPATEPVSVEEAKVHLRLDQESDDNYVAALITAARQHAEAYTGRSLVSQTWDLKMDAFPACGEITVPLPPLASITSITYVDTAGTSTVWGSSNYIVDAPAGPHAAPGRITPAYGVSWPGTRQQINAVTVRFVAGTAVASVPEEIKQGMLMLIGSMYENRQNVVMGGQAFEVPQASAWLWQPFRVMGW